MSLEEYYEKRKKAQLAEASELVREYRKVYNKNPGADELSEFFFLFSNENHKETESWQRQMKNVGNYDETCLKLEKNVPMFKSMDEFLSSIK